MNKIFDVVLPVATARAVSKKPNLKKDVEEQSSDTKPRRGGAAIPRSKSWKRYWLASLVIGIILVLLAVAAGFMIGSS